MSTYLDQSSTNPDLSRTETPQAPTLEFELFNLGGGLPKHLDDEPLETRDVQSTTWTANVWRRELVIQKHDGQRPRLKSLIVRPGDSPSAGEMQQSAALALARPMSTSSALRLFDIDQFKVDSS